LDFIRTLDKNELGLKIKTTVTELYELDKDTVEAYNDRVLVAYIMKKGNSYIIEEVKCKTEFLNVAYSREGISIPLGMRKLKVSELNIVGNSILATVKHSLIENFKFIDESQKTAFLLFADESGYKRFLKSQNILDK